jgi:hypothetical protein
MEALLLMSVLVVLCLGFLALEAFALARWSGGWRVLATIPGLPLCMVIAKLVVDLHRDPTSHNLWPIELLTWSVLGALLLGILGIAHRFAARRST